MRLLAFLILSLPLLVGACAPMTGDADLDCLNARKLFAAASVAASGAGLVAANNPQSLTMQRAAQLAAVSATLAQSQVAQLCPNPAKG